MVIPNSAVHLPVLHSVQVQECIQSAKFTSKRKKTKRKKKEKPVCKVITFCSNGNVFGMFWVKDAGTKIAKIHFGSWLSVFMWVKFAEYSCAELAHILCVAYDLLL